MTQTPHPVSRRRRRQAGMTLIELIVAVTLFALISGSIGVLLRVAFTSMERINSKVNFNRRVLGSQKALDQMLAGIMPVPASCTGLTIPFQGNAAVMRFVSSYSLQEGSRGRPQIIELLVQPRPDGEGARLLVNQFPYLGPASLAAFCTTQPAARPSSFVLSDRLSLCRFAYQRIEPGGGAATWFPSWRLPGWPSQIRVELAPLRLEPGQIQPVTIHSQLMARRAQ
jgi:prepilin-type N-terminal cleavage/methylation domain-containing protein